MAPLGLRGGFPTYWRAFGTGPRPALMFHCSLAHSGAFAALAGELGDLLTMRAFDLPGHGQSGAWQGEPPLQRLTVDMARDLLEEPCDLIGHSFGATAALRLACEMPDLVRSLVLIEPVFFAVACADHPELAAPHHAQMAEIARLIDAGDRESATRLFLRAWGDGRPWDRLLGEAQQAMMAQIHLITAAQPEIGEDSAGLLTSGALERLDRACLLIEGGESPAPIAQINEGLQRRIAGSRRAVIPGAGHMVPITHPVEVAAEIRPFLNQLPG